MYDLCVYVSCVMPSPERSVGPMDPQYLKVRLVLTKPPLTLLVDVSPDLDPVDGHMLMITCQGGVRLN